MTAPKCSGILSSTPHERQHHFDACEQHRLGILTDVEAGRLAPEEAAPLLGISVPQLRRVRAAYRDRDVAARKSSLLMGVGEDATIVARAVANRAAATPPQ